MIFTGRKRILTQVSTVFADVSEPQVMVLYGLPGVGKTQIARHYMSENEHRYKDMAWADLESATDAKSVIDTVMKGKKTKKETLLVIDGATDISQIDGMYPTKGHVLITTVNPNVISLGKNIPIFGFTQEDTMQFVKSRIADATQSNCLSLGRAVSFMPVLLEIACQKIKDNTIDISAYLDQFEADPKAALTLSTPLVEYEKGLSNRLMSMIRALSSESRFYWDLMLMMVMFNGADVPTPLLDPDDADFRHALDVSADQEDALKIALKILQDLTAIQQKESISSLHPLLDLFLPDFMSISDHRKWVDQVSWFLLQHIQKGDKSSFELVRSVVAHAKKYCDDFDGMIRLLNEIGMLTKADDKYELSIEFFDLALSLLTLLPEQTAKVYGATLCNNMGLAYMESGEFDPAIECFRESLDYKVSLYGEEHVSLAVSLNNLGRVLTFKEEYEDAKNVLSQALSIKLSNMDPTNSSLGLTRLNIARVEKELGNYAEAIESGEAAYKCFVASVGPEDDSAIDTIKVLLLVMREMKDLDGQDVQLRRLITSLDPKGTSTSQDVLVLRFDLALLYYSRDDRESCLTELNSLLSLLRSLGARQERLLMDVLYELGAIAIEDDQFDHAESCLEESRDLLFLRLDSVPLIRQLEIMYELSVVYRHRGDSEKEFQQLQDFMSMFEENQPADITVLNGVMRLAYLLEKHDEGGQAQAVDLLKRALSISEQLSGSSSIESARILVQIGAIYIATKEYELAKDNYKEAGRIFRQHLGSNHHLVAQCLMNVGLSYGHLGCISFAKKCLDGALQIFAAQPETSGRWMPITRYYLAQILYKLQDVAGAREHAQLAYDRLNRLDQVPGSMIKAVASFIKSLPES